MPKAVSEIRIVVASPGDVSHERDALSHTVEEINQTIASEIGVTLRLLRWETAVTPGFSSRGPQELIDKILDIPNCDIFIGIFWRRFGTAVYDADSGTQHEFQKAYEAWRLRQRPQILFYFSEEPYSPKEKSETEQWGQVLEFKQNFPKEGLWWSYSNPTEFQTLVRRHLVHHVLRISRVAPGEPNHQVVETATRKALFVGRMSEIARLERHVSDETNVLIIIEGIAGIGKSSLARNLLERLTAKAYRCLWLDCQAETTLDSVLWEVSKWARVNDQDLSAALDEAPDADAKRLTYLADIFTGRRLLVFLDDYHLVRDVMVDRLLTLIADRPSKTRAILISRRRPNLLVRLSAGSAVEEHLSNGLDDTACEQFLGKTGINVDSETINRIWTLTGGGHPKALQLLAHRAIRIPIRQLLGTLPVFRVDLVREWLNPLLEELSVEERATLLDLSIFERPLPFSDLSRLLPDGNGDNVIASLSEGFLVDPVSETSFQIHPLVREFCATLVEEPKSKHQWAADYYKDKCGSLDDPDFAEDGQIEALVAAWSHYIKADNQAAATEVVETLRAPLMNRGHYERILQLVQETSPPDSSDADFFKIHVARLRSLKGDVAGATAILTPLLSTKRTRTAREAVLVLSTILNEHGAAPDAWRLLETNRSYFTGAVSSRIKLRFLSRVVQAFIEMRDYDKALDWARHLTEVSEAAGDKISGALGLRQMAESFLSQRKFDTALELTKISLDLFQSEGRAREAAKTEFQIAKILIARGDQERGRMLLDKTLEAFTSIGDRVGISHCRQELRSLEFRGDSFSTTA
jgi:tetratricopeptide (TPR) repeat protein